MVPRRCRPGNGKLIAAFVSTGDDCYFCAHSHAAVARHALADDGTVVDAACADPSTAPVGERMRIPGHSVKSR